MLWLDLTDHNLTIWQNPLDDGIKEILVCPLDPTDMDIGSPPLSTLIDMGGVIDLEHEIIRFAQMPPVSEWMRRFEAAKIRWLPADANIARLSPEGLITENRQWLWLVENPDPARLQLQAGTDLSAALGVYSANELSARQIGQVLPVTPGSVEFIAEHPTLDLMYGVPKDTYRAGYAYQEELPIYEMTGSAQESAQESAQDGHPDSPRQDEPTDGGDLPSAPNDPGSAEDGMAKIDPDDHPDDDLPEGGASGRREDFGRVIAGARKHVWVLAYSPDDGGDLMKVRERLKSALSLDKLWPKSDINALIRDESVSPEQIVFAMAVRDSLHLSYPSMVPISGKGGHKNNRYIDAQALTCGSLAYATAVMNLRQTVTAASDLDRIDFGRSMLERSTIKDGRIFNYSLRSLLEKMASEGSLEDELAWNLLPVVGSPHDIQRRWTSVDTDHSFNVLPKRDDGSIDLEVLAELRGRVSRFGDDFASASRQRSYLGLSDERLMVFDLYPKCAQILVDRMSKTTPSLGKALLEAWQAFVASVHAERMTFINTAIRSETMKWSLAGIKDPDQINEVAERIRDLITGPGYTAVDNVTRSYDQFIRLVERLALAEGTSFRTALIEPSKRSKPEESDKAEEDEVEIPGIMVKDVPSQVPESARFARKSLYDWRKGQDIDEGAVCNRFGFSGIQYGNYVNQKERQGMLNDCYDALADIAVALEIPDRFMGVDGRLALAFGARGRGGKSAGAAHFEPGERVINFTKKRGSGFLVHELFHGWDNYLGDRVGTRYLTQEIDTLGWTQVPSELTTLVEGTRQLVKSWQYAQAGTTIETMEAGVQLARQRAFADFERAAFSPDYLRQRAASLIMRKGSKVSGDQVLPEAVAEQLVMQVAAGWRQRIAGFMQRVSKDSTRLFCGEPYGEYSYVYNGDALADKIIEHSQQAGQPMNEVEGFFASSWAGDLYKSASKYFKADRGSSGKSVSIMRGESMFAFSGRVLDSMSARKTPYWSSPIEYAARAMSSVIRQVMDERDAGNDWAAKSSEPLLFGEGYVTSPNLEGAELTTVTQSFKTDFLPSLQQLAINLVGERTITQAELAVDEARQERLKDECPAMDDSRDLTATNG